MRAPSPTPKPCAAACHSLIDGEVVISGSSRSLHLPPFALIYAIGGTNVPVLPTGEWQPYRWGMAARPVTAWAGLALQRNRGHARRSRGNAHSSAQPATAEQRPPGASAASQRPPPPPSKPPA